MTNLYQVFSNNFEGLYQSELVYEEFLSVYREIDEDETYEDNKEEELAARGIHRVFVTEVNI